MITTRAIVTAQSNISGTTQLTIQEACAKTALRLLANQAKPYTFGLTKGQAGEVFYLESSNRVLRTPGSSQEGTRGFEVTGTYDGKSLFVVNLEGLECRYLRNPKVLIVSGGSKYERAFNKLSDNKLEAKFGLGAGNYSLYFISGD